MSYIKELQKGNETLSSKNKMLEEKISILEEKIKEQRVEYRNLMNDRNEVSIENTKLRKQFKENSLNGLLELGFSSGYLGNGIIRLFEMEEN